VTVEAFRGDDLRRFVVTLGAQPARS
jgi:hypothetical protein